MSTPQPESPGSSGSSGSSNDSSANPGSPTGASAKRKPSFREVMKPVELLVMGLVAGVFTGVITFMSTRNLLLAVIFMGVAFIVTLVVIALFVLSIKPGEIEQADIDRQNNAHDGPTLGH